MTGPPRRNTDVPPSYGCPAEWLSIERRILGIDLWARARKTGGDGSRGSRLLSLEHLEDLVRQLAVGFTVDCQRSLHTRRFRETEDAAGRRVVPVLHIAHAVFTLDCEVLGVLR